MTAVDTFLSLGRKTALVAVITGFTLSGSFAVATPVKVSIPADIETQAVKKVSAEVVIDAPPAAVWQTITNYASLKSILPGYEKSAVLSAKGNIKTVDVAMKVNRFLPTYKYQVRVTENPAAKSLTMNRISGDFKSMSASYQLKAINGGKSTVLLYTLSMDPGNRLPGTGGILRSNTERSMSALSSHIETQARQSETASHR